MYLYAVQKGRDNRPVPQRGNALVNFPFKLVIKQTRDPRLILYHRCKPSHAHPCYHRRMSQWHCQASIFPPAACGVTVTRTHSRWCGACLWRRKTRHRATNVGFRLHPTLMPPCRKADHSRFARYCAPAIAPSLTQCSCKTGFNDTDFGARPYHTLSGSCTDMIHVVIVQDAVGFVYQQL